ncbi:hypothetical protein N7468_009890 [Penicillium chermesinum]|uniref:Uncharacterized protein n=1 Tax=Penicillium chermesinum TaxID=63820 RepID=A0A9W9NBN2_9EURO|nr:uncharacterized protein N7468_009890 [Penicillium chermesinum]KAJ5216882.1 hypothetical protein N7468_009890 [Penicillium chermesinum]
MIVPRDGTRQGSLGVVGGVRRCVVPCIESSATLRLGPDALALKARRHLGLVARLQYQLERGLMELSHRMPSS